MPPGAGKVLSTQRLGRGQTTDDTELTICLARGTWVLEKREGLGEARSSVACLRQSRSAAWSASAGLCTTPPALPTPCAGLSGHPPSQGLPAESVAREYCYWHAAGAFGGGMTCQTAFSVAEADRGKWIKSSGEASSASAPCLATRMLVRPGRQAHAPAV